VTAPDVNQDPGRVGQLPPDVRRELAAQLAPDLAPALAQHQREVKAADDRAKSKGGPCQFCGTTVSWERPGVGGWLQLGGAPVCHICAADRGGLAGDDREHRIRACDLILGDYPAPPDAGAGPPTVRARWWPDYKADAMRWWFEVPGARPGQGAKRFAYTTAAELTDRLYRETREQRKRAAPVLRSRGRRHRCPGCGARGEVWRVEQVGVSTATTSTGELSTAQRAHFRVTWTCHRCGHIDVERLAEQVPGVPVAGLVG
jgi:hypothetical protein